MDGTILLRMRVRYYSWSGQVLRASEKYVVVQVGLSVPR